MSRFDAFLGPFNTSVSPNITSELTMNWIPERNAVPVNDMGTDVKDKNIRCSLVRTPGLATFVDLTLTPVRGLFPGESRLFAVAGDHFFEIFPEGSGFSTIFITSALLRYETSTIGSAAISKTRPAPAVCPWI